MPPNIPTAPIDSSPLAIIPSVLALMQICSPDTRPNKKLSINRTNNPDQNSSSVGMRGFGHYATEEQDRSGENEPSPTAARADSAGAD